jgi:hypothetical protein
MYAVFNLSLNVTFINVEKKEKEKKILRVQYPDEFSM